MNKLLINLYYFNKITQFKYWLINIVK